MPLLSHHLSRFYKEISIPDNLPADVTVLFPQKSLEVLRIQELFFKKYYSDNNPRHFIFGINPGRFGAGTTGINFTAPKQLTNFCKIDHPIKGQSELSAEFIYEMIERYGGCEKFYGDFFLTAVSPVGFTKKGVNLNYYDDKKLQTALEPFLIKNIKHQLEWTSKRDTCICLGGEKNFKFLTRINNEHKFFETIIPLPHPRFILQYRRPEKESYIRKYLSVLNSTNQREFSSNNISRKKQQTTKNKV